MSRYDLAEAYIVNRLKSELPSRFHYHNLTHVMDVVEAAERIAIAENVDSLNLELLKVAALFHDSGFLVKAENHESISCEIVKQVLPGMGYDEKEIDRICSIVMATKIPQSPSNLLERIMCDADLDYLGRDDFYATGNKVFREMREAGVVNDVKEWNQLQVSFLSSHNYFTDTSNKLRKAKKQEHLDQIRQLIEEKP